MALQRFSHKSHMAYYCYYSIKSKSYLVWKVSGTRFLQQICSRRRQAGLYACIDPPPLMSAHIQSLRLCRTATTCNSSPLFQCPSVPTDRPLSQLQSHVGRPPQLEEFFVSHRRLSWLNPLTFLHFLAAQIF